MITTLNVEGVLRDTELTYQERVVLCLILISNRPVRKSVIGEKLDLHIRNTFRQIKGLREKGYIRLKKIAVVEEYRTYTYIYLNEEKYESSDNVLS